MADLEDIPDEMLGNLVANTIWKGLKPEVRQQIRANMTINEEQDVVRGIREARRFLKNR